MAKALSKDATFTDLRSSPQKAERFVRKVLGVLGKARKAHGDVRVRMGTTGSGLAPNYRVEEPSGRPLFAIDGANHLPWPEGKSFEGQENWSTITMSQGEVEEVLRALTGYKGAGTETRPQV